MTVTVRQDVPNTPITPQRGLLSGNVLPKLNSLTTYLASAISVHVISLHVGLSVQPLGMIRAGRKAMVLWQGAILRAKAVLVTSEGCGRRPTGEGSHLSLLIYPEFGLPVQP